MQRTKETREKKKKKEKKGGVEDNGGKRGNVYRGNLPERICSTFLVKGICMGDSMVRAERERRRREKKREREREREREARVLALRVAGGQRRNGRERLAGLYGTVLPPVLAEFRGWLGMRWQWTAVPYRNTPRIVTFLFAGGSDSSDAAPPSLTPVIPLRLVTMPSMHMHG